MSKTSLLQVRLTHAEKARLKKAARADGINQSELVRVCLAKILSPRKRRARRG